MTDPRTCPTVCNVKFTGYHHGSVYACALPKGHDGDHDDHPTRGLPSFGHDAAPPAPTQWLAEHIRVAAEGSQPSTKESASCFWAKWHKDNPNIPGERMIDRMVKFAEAYAVSRQSEGSQPSGPTPVKGEIE